jgi:hypothetical protein
VQRCCQRSPKPQAYQSGPEINTAPPGASMCNALKSIVFVAIRSDRCYRSRCCHHSSEPRCDPFALANLASSRFQHPCCWAATLPRSTGVDTQHTIHNIKSEEDTQSNETSSSQGSPGSLYSTLILESAKQVLRITPLSSIYHVVLIHR